LSVLPVRRQRIAIKIANLQTGIFIESFVGK